MKIKRFYRRIIFSLFLILPFLFSTAYADSNTDKKDMQWLFVISSKEGAIKQNNQGQYELILKHAHIERVLAFTDRPNHLIKLMSPDAFKSLWDKGPHSFQDDPPNAAVVFGQRKITMKLMGIQVKNDQTSFMVASDDDSLHAVNMGETAVFIDMREIVHLGN